MVQSNFEHVVTQRVAVERAGELRVESAPSWYAAYTKPRHEKNVRRECERRDIDCFLPTYEVARRWKDRRKQIELPLFPGYIFVRISRLQQLKILQVPSVVSLVGFGGRPTSLRDEEVATLQKGLAAGVSCKPHPYLVTGCPVRIVAGPLAGSEGVLVRRKGNLRVILSLELLRRSIAVDADIADIQPLSVARRTK